MQIRRVAGLYDTDGVTDRRKIGAGYANCIRILIDQIQSCSELPVLVFSLDDLELQLQVFAVSFLVRLLV